MNIKNEINKRLSKLTKQKFTDKSDIYEIGIDSLDLVELITEVEEQFELSIPDEELEKIKTVNDVIKLFEKVSKSK